MRSVHPKFAIAFGIDERNTNINITVISTSNLTCSGTVFRSHFLFVFGRKKKNVMDLKGCKFFHFDILSKVEYYLCNKHHMVLAKQNSTKHQNKEAQTKAKQIKLEQKKRTKVEH